MFKVQNLSFSFKEKRIFNHINLDFQLNQVTGIVGKNGIGKTTLFRLLTGIYPLQNGHIQYDGKGIQKKDIAFLPTDPYFYPYMYGKEYINIVAPSEGEQQLAHHYSSLLDVPVDQLVDQYSTGMKKKLAFATLFALHKPIIILDEPYNGVDLEGNEIMKHIIQKNRGQKTILLSSHILSTIIEVSQSIYYLKSADLISHYASDQYADLQAHLSSDIQNKIDRI